MKHHVPVTTALTFMACICLTLCMFALAGCKGSQDTATEPGVKVEYANAYCPIMVEKEIDPAKVKASLTREFKGKKVAFCCKGCLPKWDALNDEEKAAKLEQVAVAR